MDYSLSTLTTFLLRMFEVFAEFSIIFNSFNKKIKPLHFALAIFLCNAIAQFLKPIVPYSIYWIIPPILIFHSLCYSLNLNGKKFLWLHL